MGISQQYNPPIAYGSRQGPLVVLQILFILVASIIFCLRLFTRAYVLHSVASDDYLMGVAMILSIGLTINACISTHFGWGRHLHEVPITDLPGILLCVWIAELVFTITTTLVKLSVLFFYLRIAVTTTYRRVIYASIVFILIWGITFSCVVIFQCSPVSSYWVLSKTKCFNPEAALFVHGLTNSLTDIWVYVLPMRMVWKTQLPKRQRIGLLVIFGAGFLVCVSGCLRLYYSVNNVNSDDATWVGFELWTWESIEVNLGIVCASAPCLKAFIAKFLPKLLGSRGRGSDMSNTPGATYQRYGRRDGGAPHYILEDRGTFGRDGRVERESAESQEGLTKKHELTLVAKADSDRMV